MVGVALVQQWPHGGRCINKVIDQESSSEYGLASTCIGNKFHKDYIGARVFPNGVPVHVRVGMGVGFGAFLPSSSCGHFRCEGFLVPFNLENRAKQVNC